MLSKNIAYLRSVKSCYGPEPAAQTSFAYCKSVDKMDHVAKTRNGQKIYCNAATGRVAIYLHPNSVHNALGGQRLLHGALRTNWSH